MARSQKQLAGWDYVLSVEEVPDSLSPRKRVSRRSDETKLILRRDADRLEIQQGDCILVSQEDDLPDVAIVKEIRFGTDNFIELMIMWFIRLKDVDKEDLPKGGYHENEIFLTAVLDKTSVSLVIEKANVLSAEKFKQIEIDDSNVDTTFVCKMGCDSSAVEFSKEIDFSEFHSMAVRDSDGFLQSVKGITVPATKKFMEPVRVRDVKKSGKKRGRPKGSKKRVTEEGDGVGHKGHKGHESGHKDHKTLDENHDGDISMKSESEPDSESDLELSSNESSDESVESDFSDESFTRKRRAPSTPKKTPWRKMNKKTPKSCRLSAPALPQTRRKLHFDVEGSPTKNSVATPGFLKRAKQKLHTGASLKALPGREDEFGELYSVIESAISAEMGCCIYVSGTPGTGKTATIREVIKQLSSELNERKTSFNYLEINGLKLIKPQAAYELLWEKISGDRVSSSQAAVLLETHFQNSREEPLVVLMDELDQIVTKNQAVMYNFFNWPSYQNSNLIVIAVANTMDLPERMLTNKISSRLGLTRLQFPGYTFQQLSEIIKRRLETLSRVNSGTLIINKEAIEFASRKVASVSGDARRALNICLRAVEIAEWEFLHKTDDEKKEVDMKYAVQIIHIMKAVNETTSSTVTCYLGSLSFLCKLFLMALLLRSRRTGLAENSMADVLDEMTNMVNINYFKKVKQMASEAELNFLEVVFQDSSIIRTNALEYVISELVENGIILHQSNRGRSLAIVKLNIGEDEILSVFKKDEFIEELVKS